MVTMTRGMVAMQVAMEVAILFFQEEDGIRVPLWSRGLGDVYRRQRQGGAGRWRQHAGLHVREKLVAGVDDVEVAHGER